MKIKKRIFILLVVSLLSCAAAVVFSAGCSCGACEHSWGEWTVTVEPGCIAAGEEERTCTECGETQSRSVPAVGHKTGSDYGCDSEKHWRVCTVCGERIGEEKHTADDGICTVCGCSTELVYSLSPDGESYTLTDAGAAEGELTVPETWAEKPVTAIGRHAFEGSSVTAVTLPDSVTSIQPYAFSGCSSLVSADLGEGLDYIGDEAFAGCTRLYSVRIGGDLGYVGQYAFEDCDRLVEVYDLSGNGIEAGSRGFGYAAYRALAVYTSDDVPSGITEVGDFVFMRSDDGARLIEYTGDGGDVSLPEDFEGSGYAVNARAFFGRTDIKSVDFGGAEEIGDKAFCGSGITSFAGSGKLTEIGDGAFSHCADLAEVDLKGIVRIGANAFEYTAIAEVYIPASVTVMGGYVFDGCSLTSVKCEAESAPAGWNEYWIMYGAGADSVVWGAAAD